MASIAGRDVSVGDKLWHIGFCEWLVVTDVSQDKRSFFVKAESKTTGVKAVKLLSLNGYINGRRVLYWHKPLELDLPTDDISAVQEVLNNVLKFGRDYDPNRK